MLAKYRTTIPYIHNQDCTLIFNCPADKQLVVNVDDFDVGYDSCDDDESDDDESDGDLSLITYVSFDGHKKCGSRIPVVSTSKSEFEINFHSNFRKNIGNKIGFRLSLGCKGMYTVYCAHCTVSIHRIYTVCILSFPN